MELCAAGGTGEDQGGQPPGICAGAHDPAVHERLPRGRHVADPSVVALCPASLVPLDPALCVISIAIYLYGMVSPVRTVLDHWSELTPTEQLRMKGMVASGAVGAVFVLNTGALLLHGAGWWQQVLELYPGQSILEPSTALFGAYAVEAGMLVHRAARKGLVTFQWAVPFYGYLVLPMLTLLPMGCLFWYKQAEVSFWSFLFL